jgi:hypothetical protein
MKDTPVSAIVAAAELSRLDRVFERLRPNGISPDVGDPEEVAAELSWAATRLALYRSKVLKRINYTIPAVCLPADILLYIFREVVDSEYVDPRTTKMPVSAHALLISHVCHQWRQLALANPTLWSTLFSVWRHKGVIEDVAMRVASAPLTVHTVVPEHWAYFPELFDMVAPSVRALYIHAMFSSPVAGMLRNHPHPLPALEELHVLCNQSSEDTEWTKEDPVILETFIERTPALQTLVLRNYTVNSEASCLARITRLDVIMDNSDTLIQYLLQLLSHVPLAEHVTLETAIDHGAPFEPPSALCVMRNIKVLELLDSSLILSKMLPHLRLPASASLVLMPTGGYSSEHQLKHLIDATHTHPHVPHSAPLTHLLVTLDDEAQMLSMHAKTVEGCSTQVEISMDLYLEPCLYVLEEWVAALPVSRVLELDLRDTLMGRTTLRKLLTDSTRLERLSQGSSSCLYMLQEYSDDEAFVWLSGLRELCLTGSELSDVHPFECVEYRLVLKKSPLDTLKAFLIGFRRVNGPLPQLTLIKCIVTKYETQVNGEAIDAELEEDDGATVHTSKEVREGLSEDFVAASGLRDLVKNLRVVDRL